MSVGAVLTAPPPPFPLGATPTSCRLNALPPPSLHEEQSGSDNDHPVSKIKEVLQGV